MRRAQISNDLRRILTERMPVPPRDEARAALAIFRRLAGQGAFRVEDLAADAEFTPRLLESPPLWRLAERGADGMVVGFGGLTVNPTPTRFRSGRRELYTWCAWDSLFIPELLRQVVDVEATCPTTGEVVSLRVSAAGVDGLTPETAVLSLVAPRSDHGCITLATTRECFCRHVRFYSSPSAAGSWLADHPNERVVTVEEGHALGVLKNALQYGSLLTQ